jgi:hypothetical protein
MPLIAAECTPEFCMAAWNIRQSSANLDDRQSHQSSPDWQYFLHPCHSECEHKLPRLALRQFEVGDEPIAKLIDVNL